jgi:hypothetical protein
VTCTYQNDTQQRTTTVAPNTTTTETFTFQPSPSSGTWIVENLTLNINGIDVMNDGVTVIAGNNNGDLFKSADEGLTWEYIWTFPWDPESSPLPHPPPAWTVFVDSRDYIFIAGYLGSGLWRSIDGGNSWTEVWSDGDSTVPPEGITEDDQGSLYIGTYPPSGIARIWKSSDGGDTWIEVFNAPDYGISGKHIHHVKFSPISKCVYALVANIPESGTGIDGFEFRSSDYGQTWERIVDFDNWMGIGFKDGWLYLTTDGHPDVGASQNRVYKLEDIPSGAVSQPNSDNEVWGYGITYDGSIGLPDDQYIWWFRTTPDNKFLLMGGGPCSNDPEGYVHLWYSETGDKDSWSWIERGTQIEGIMNGYVRASHKWSKNGWLFVQNGITGQGMRIKWTPSASVENTYGDLLGMIGSIVYLFGLLCGYLKLVESKFFAYFRPFSELIFAFHSQMTNNLTRFQSSIARWIKSRRSFSSLNVLVWVCSIYAKIFARVCFKYSL